MLSVRGRAEGVVRVVGRDNQYTWKNLKGKGTGIPLRNFHALPAFLARTKSLLCKRPKQEVVTPSHPGL